MPPFPVCPSRRLTGNACAPRPSSNHLSFLVRCLQRLTHICLFAGAWAAYTTARYYVGAWLHPERERQILALALGSASVGCLACLAGVVILAAVAPARPGAHPYHPRWCSKNDLLLRRARIVLRATALLLLVAPAVANLVLTVLWRSASNAKNSLRGRCHWDVDVVWTGFGGVCQHAPAFGAWLAGALVRLVLTVGVVVSRSCSVGLIEFIFSLGLGLEFHSVVRAYRYLEDALDCHGRRDIEPCPARRLAATRERIRRSRHPAGRSASGDLAPYTAVDWMTSRRAFRKSRSAALY